MTQTITKLAIAGGTPVRSQPFPRYNTIGEAEKRAVAEVLDSAVLSEFLGQWTPQFYGGPRVQALEREWAEFFGAKHAVSVNSATSGLYAAVGAAGVGPGDEVIVSPFTMSASATAALVYGAIPVFADIDEDIFCITPAAIRRLITPLTKAIIVVDLLGHPADMDEIMALAAEHNLVVIEDAAQAPGARLHGRYAGTFGHMGVFSLNRHKQIHTGEGGIVVTDDPRLAERLQLIRNHAEVVVNDKGVDDLVNMVGFNYRLGEIEAAIAREQLKRLPTLLATRRERAAYLTDRLSGLPGLRLPVVRPGAEHSFYLYAIRYDEDATGIPRDDFVAAVNAEGVPLSKGYGKPLYLEPLYQRRIAFGAAGFPFTYPGYTGTVSYERGICPVTERMYFKELIVTNACHATTEPADMDDVAEAFVKVLANPDEARR
jgi:dTDP-4-amino-4,6-dideoxygalactose transaminase